MGMDEAAETTLLTALEPVLNHADASISAAGARAMGRLGAADKVVNFCREYLGDDNPLADRLACIKALRAAGEAQLALLRENERSIRAGGPSDEGAAVEAMGAANAFFTVQQTKSSRKLKPLSK